jgi:LysR family nitrogen assimilation transcriptional regulator
MDLKQLEVFVHVADLGSFTRAAGHLRIAQPALSRQVRALEVELRQSLFDRNGRGVTLTPAGQRLLAHGRGILAQVERARHDLEAHRGAPAGRLALGVPPSVGRTLTGPLVRAFRGQFPQGTLTMVEGLTTYVLEWLAQGRVDAAVAYDVAPGAHVDLMPVRQEPMLLISGAASAMEGPPQEGAPAGMADLARHALVIPSRPHAIRMRVEGALAEAGLKPRVALEIESVPAMLDLVQQQGLHAVLSRQALHGHPRPGAFSLRPLLLERNAQPLTASLWIATASQRPRTPLLEAALPLLLDLLRRDEAAGRT